MFWNKPKREERIRDLLLVVDDALGERLDAVGLPLESHFDHGDGKTYRRCKLLGDGVDIALGSVVDLAELSEHHVHDLRIALEEFLR